MATNRAPWLKDIWFFGTSYIIPNVDNVVLGGTAGKGDWNTTVSLSDTKTILENIAQVFPSIYDAPIVSLRNNLSVPLATWPVLNAAWVCSL
jgi:glycine/D-amino acid oxidase-like deaminating enzyme